MRTRESFRESRFITKQRKQPASYTERKKLANRKRLSEICGSEDIPNERGYRRDLINNIMKYTNGQFDREGLDLETTEKLERMEKQYRSLNEGVLIDIKNIGTMIATKIKKFVKEHSIDSLWYKDTLKDILAKDIYNTWKFLVGVDYSENANDFEMVDGILYAKKLGGDKDLYSVFEEYLDTPKAMKMLDETFDNAPGFADPEKFLQYIIDSLCEFAKEDFENVRKSKVKKVKTSKEDEYQVRRKKFGIGR